MILSHAVIFLSGLKHKNNSKVYLRHERMRRVRYDPRTTSNGQSWEHSPSLSLLLAAPASCKPKPRYQDSSSHQPPRIQTSKAWQRGNMRDRQWQVDPSVRYIVDRAEKDAFLRYPTALQCSHAACISQYTLYNRVQPYTFQLCGEVRWDSFWSDIRV